MKNGLRLLFVIFTLPFVVSCSVVKMERPLPKNGKVDAQKMNGAWESEGTPIYIGLVDESEGRMGGTKWDDENKEFKVENYKLYFSEVERKKFVSIQEEDNKWVYARYEWTESGNLICWMADAEFLAKAIKDKKLKGRIDESDRSLMVHLTNTPEEILAFLADLEKGQGFEYEVPFVLKKMTKE